jgi:lysophospholipase L1-like esterase
MTIRIGDPPVTATNGQLAQMRADLGISGANLRSPTPTALGLALAKTVSGVSDTRILLAGDSTTRGRGGTPGLNDIATFLAARLSKILPVPVISNFITPDAVGGTLDTARITLGAGWSGLTGYGWGNTSAWYVGSGSTTLTINYSSGFSNKIRLYFARYPAAPGSFTPVVNSATLATQSMAGTIGVVVYEATYTRSATANVVITPSGGLVILLGVEFIDTTQKCVYIANAGAAGTTSLDWNTVTNYSTDKMLPVYAPNHIMLNLGINDSVLNTATATWSTRMNTLISTMQAYAAVDLWKFFQTDPAQPYVATLQPQYYAEFANLSSALNCTVLDLYQASGGYTYLNSAGAMADIAHPNGIGYAMVVPTIADRILSFA